MMRAPQGIHRADGAMSKTTGSSAATFSQYDALGQRLTAKVNVLLTTTIKDIGVCPA